MPNIRDVHRLLRSLFEVFVFLRLSVRVVQSSRAGMGKSLLVKHLADQVTTLSNNKKLRKGLVSSLSPTIPVHGVSVDSDRVTRTLLSHAVERHVPVSRIFHLDMSQSVSNMHTVCQIHFYFYVITALCNNNDDKSW